jgi:nitric oxide reductase large subunit
MTRRRTREFNSRWPGTPEVEAVQAKAVAMWWMNFIIVPGVLILGIYGFLVLAGFQKRMLTRRTSRTAESMYGNYADPPRKQRMRARKRD